jgi:hypothetical protein
MFYHCHHIIALSDTMKVRYLKWLIACLIDHASIQNEAECNMQFQIYS